MSDVIENTFSSLSRLLNENLLSGISGSPSTSTKVYAPPKGFENFIRAVSCARNKHDEDAIINRELRLLKQRFSQPDVTTAQSKEYMVRVIYCGLLGYDVSFAGIHAVKLAQHGNLQEKRTGYLVASLLLHEDHELTLLLINTIQKDLWSSNILENCMGLMLVCQLVGPEMAPTLLPAIIEKLKHPREVVRKKAVMCIQKFHERCPASVHHLNADFRTALCDRDPGVMSAALHIYLQMLQKDASSHRDMVEGFVGTLTQVITRKLPPDLDYHGIPAPWAQVRLLRVLAALGHNHQRSSALMYDVVRETLQRAAVKDNAAFAVMYECIVTIATIWPNEDLLHTAAMNVGKFLRSKSNNFRYIGLKALGCLVKCGPEFVRDYQMIVVECLDDPDPAIQRQTYDLLYRMTNASNVEVICQRLIKYLSNTNNRFTRTDLTSKVTQLINDYSPSDQWYINTMNGVIEVNGEDAPPQCFKSLLNKIKKGCCGDDENAQELRDFAVSTYHKYLQRPSLAPVLLNVTSWVLGEYGHTVSSSEASAACAHFVRHYEKTNAESCRNYILSALRKLLINGVISPGDLDGLVTKLETSTKGHNLKQRLLELKRFSKCQPSHLQALRVSSPGKDRTMDFTLSFLDSFVSEALEGGGMAYRPRGTRLGDNRKNSEMKSLFGDIQYEQYSGLVGNPGADNSAELSRQGGSTDSAQSGSEVNDGRLSGLNMSGVRRVWGRRGVVRADTSDLSSSPGSAHSADHQQTVQQQQQRLDLKPEHEDKQTEDRRRREELAAALFSGIDSSSDQQKHLAPQRRTDKQNVQEDGEILVKGKPVDGHDWRKFRKPAKDSTSTSTMTSLCGHMAELHVQTPPQAKPDIMAFEDTVTNLPTQPELTLPASENHQTPEDSISENLRQQNSLYDILKCELTEEDLLEISNTDQQESQEKPNQVRYF